MTDEERDNYRWLSITNKLLTAMLGDSTLIKQWWLSPNRAFNLLTPRQQWEIDNHVVVQYVMSTGIK